MDRAGIREVAKAAGVSISTVSRAFTRPELVSERTRRKVLETAESGSTYQYVCHCYFAFYLNP